MKEKLIYIYEKNWIQILLIGLISDGQKRVTQKPENIQNKNFVTEKKSPWSIWRTQEKFEETFATHHDTYEEIQQMSGEIDGVESSKMIKQVRPSCQMELQPKIPQVVNDIYYSDEIPL